MTTTLQAPPAHLVKLDNILESVIVLNWKDLVQGQSTGVVQIEYHVGADRSVDCLKMWRSTPQGYSSLVCNYALKPDWSSGPCFSNGFHSRDLGHLLESIMLNQHLFQLGSEPNSNVVIQVSPPTPEQVESAKLQLRDSFPPPVPVARKAGSRRHPELPVAATV